MDEIDYQMCLMVVEQLVLQGLLTADEKDAAVVRLKEEFRPPVTLLTG